MSDNNVAQPFDQEFVEAFSTGLANSFQALTSSEGKVGDPLLKQMPPKTCELAGFVGLVSPQLKGMMLMAFEKDAALFFVEKMLDEVHSEINADVKDGVAEFVNVVFGSVKPFLNSRGHFLDMCIPQVIEGAVLFRVAKTDHVLTIPLTSAKGQIYLTLVIR